MRAAFARRLDPASREPLGIALSGGGDSMALLSLAQSRVLEHGRALVAFIVDHGMNADSAAWTRFAAEAAERYGAGAFVLRWTGDKPAAGLPAAARAARHALIADAARAEGVAVVLFAHTADDVAEGEVMRAEGVSLGRLQEWSPSPAWPQGRGVFLLRPLLSVTREALREHLRKAGEGWLEDPANGDLRFARARVRAASEHGLGGSRPQPSARRAPSPRAGETSAGADGALRLSRDDALDSRTVSAALLCAAGSARPPRGDRLQRLIERLRSEGRFAATLAGARVGVADDGVLITRDFGRQGSASLNLQGGEGAVWDGRFLVRVEPSAAIVRSLQGLSRRLTPAARSALARLPAAVRPTLPALVAEDGRVSCPVLEPSRHVACSLVAERFAAAVGAIPDEAALAASRRRMAR